MTKTKAEARSKFPAAPTYDIKIPRGLPKLDGTLTRKERVAVAMDVLALLRLRSRARKIILESTYFDADIPESGQLHSYIIQGECMVCARGILFLASVDRFDRCDLAKISSIDSEAVNRTASEWGTAQARLIEGAFENGLTGTQTRSTIEFFRAHVGKHGDRKPLMRAICRNIIANHGEFKPEDVDA